MSVSAPQPGPGPQQAAPVPTPRAVPQSNPTTSQHADLHSVAVDVVSDLQALTTGLHQAGADPNSVNILLHVTDMIRQVAASLAQAPPIPNPASHQGGPQPTPAPAPAQHGGAGAPSAATGTGPSQPNPHRAIGNAVGQLLEQAHQNALQRGQQ